MTEPLRQCVSCKQHRVKRALLRIVKIRNHSIEFDAIQKKPGRGLYVCPMSACIEKMRKREIIFRVWGIKPPQDLFIRLAEHIRPQQSSFLKILGFAARSKKLVTGVESACIAAKKKRLHVLILDSHVGESTRKKIETVGKKWNVPLVYHNDETSIEQVIGKTNCRCVGITDAEFAKSLLEIQN